MKNTEEPKFHKKYKFNNLRPCGHGWAVDVDYLNIKEGDAFAIPTSNYSNIYNFIHKEGVGTISWIGVDEDYEFNLIGDVAFYMGNHFKAN